MAIRIVTGKPGSGKTYYAVKHLRDNYYDLKKNRYLKKDDTIIITNIKYLRLQHVKLDNLMKKQKLSVKEFFTYENQKKITQNKKIIYFIDECQQYFDKRFYDKDVFYYYQTHRHLGHDIYLITQNIQLIPIQLKELAELEIHAVPRNISFFGEFKYTIKSNNEAIDKKLIKKDKKIFKLFKSYSNKETETVNNPLKKYIVFLAIFFIIAFIAFYKTFFVRDNDKNYTMNSTVKTSGKENIFEKVKEKLTEKKEVIKKVNLIPVRLDYVHNKKRGIWIIEPITNVIMPLSKLPYEFFMEMYGSRLEIVAMIREDLIKEKDKNQTSKHQTTYHEKI